MLAQSIISYLEDMEISNEENTDFDAGEATVKADYSIGADQQVVW